MVLRLSPSRIHVQKQSQITKPTEDDARRPESNPASYADNLRINVDQLRRDDPHKEKTIPDLLTFNVMATEPPDTRLPTHSPIPVLNPMSNPTLATESAPPQPSSDILNMAQSNSAGSAHGMILRPRLTINRPLPLEPMLCH